MHMVWLAILWWAPLFKPSNSRLYIKSSHLQRASPRQTFTSYSRPIYSTSWLRVHLRTTSLHGLRNGSLQTTQRTKPMRFWTISTGGMCFALEPENMVVMIIIESDASPHLLDYAGSLRVEGLNNGLETTPVHWWRYVGNMKPSDIIRCLLMWCNRCIWLRSKGIYQMRWWNAFDISLNFAPLSDEMYTIPWLLRGLRSFSASITKAKKSLSTLVYAKKTSNPHINIAWSTMQNSFEPLVHQTVFAHWLQNPSTLKLSKNPGDDRIAFVL